MEKQKVYIMEADKVVAEAPVESMAISAENLAEPMEYSEDMAGLMTFEMGALSIENLNRDFRKFITREQVRHNRFIRQITVLQRNERHYLVIRRCLRYGDRVPRKYRRAYGEVIRSLASMENLREMLCGAKV